MEALHVAREFLMSDALLLFSLLGSYGLLLAAFAGVCHWRRNRAYNRAVSARVYRIPQEIISALPAQSFTTPTPGERERLARTTTDPDSDRRFQNALARLDEHDQ